LILFYTPDISDGLYSLNEEESRHCRMVLRLCDGDFIHLTDGRGNLYEARILDARSKKVTVEIINRQENYNKRDFRLHIAVAPTKSIDRFEWLLEKTTEIGIDEITPLICEHSERRQLRTERLEKVMTAAVKQSLKAYHPVLNQILHFQSFVAEQRNGQLFIAHLDEKEPALLKNLYRRGSDVTILIGPEGDFSEAELASALKASYQCVSLGNSRLRTETAALAACHTVQILNQ
jgi:16S rRNA (uracil1498-N3)-methyltransferase